MPWTRASSLDRALVCPGSTVLPREELRSKSTIEAGAWGTLAHRWAATGRIEEVKGYPNHPKLFLKKLRTVWGSDEAAEASRLMLWPSSGTHEVSVAIHFKAERARDATVAWGVVDDPDQWRETYGPGWITGTMDFLDDILGDPWVDDLKTGKEPPLPAEPQTLFYGLAAWMVKGFPDRVVQSITHWPRYPVYSLPHRADVELEAKTLDDFYTECRIGTIMHGRAVRAEDLTEYLNPGPQCAYCPSRRLCPMEKPE